MNWISVKDKMPDDDVMVLAAHKPNQSACIHVVASYREKYRNWIELATGCGCCGDSMKISHWMPLPELPKEEA